MTDTFGLRVTTVVNGDNFEARGDDPEEFLENVKALGSAANVIHDSLTTFKQAGIAKGVFSGTAPADSGAPAPAVTGGTAPPTSGPPECEGGHGPMKDFGPPGPDRKKNKKGEPYRNRYYCSKFGSDCKPRD